MPLKRPISLSFLTLPTPPTSRQPPRLCTQCRLLHRLNAPVPRIPRPTPFVPDPQTFLTLIGRNLKQHAAKFPSWETFFSLSSAQLRESGIEPARARRYLLWWRERFRNGIFGVGGDATQVRDGVAELRVVEVESTRERDRAATLTRGPGMRKIVLNVPPSVPARMDSGAESAPSPRSRLDWKRARPIAGIKLVRANVIRGTGVEPVKGQEGVARLRVQEGLWEQRRGHKVDGGERRKAEVRSKRRAAERRNAG